MGGPAPLAGCAVLVTRPQHQAQGLQCALQALGARVLLYPTIEIVPVAQSESLLAKFQPGRGVDCLIFISVNAVEQGVRLIEQAGGWPQSVKVAAVGKATGRCLSARGIAAGLVPAQGEDSEALLALPALQNVTGQRILIVRGVGGRELLGETLAKRGAKVEYAEVYRRALPAAADDRLTAWLVAGQVDVVTATSAAGLENLVALAGREAKDLLLQLPLVVVSERMLQLARRLGFEGPVRVARGAGEDAVSDAVVSLRR